MGQTPAKTFNPPHPYGSSPDANALSQTQPVQTVSAPGGGFAAQPNPAMATPATAPAQAPVFSGGGVNPLLRSRLGSGQMRSMLLGGMSDE